MQKNLIQQLTEELTAQTARAQALQQIVDELFTIAAPGAIKNALWPRYQDVEGASKGQDYDPAILDERNPFTPPESEPALAIAQQQAAHDIPYVTVGEARPYQYHYPSGRLYVEVDLKHHDPDQGAAIALYRVWRLPDGHLAAFKVDIRESE